MNEEIKEILDNIKNKYEDYYVQDIVSGNDLKQILDYITNLQEENERYKNIIDELEKDLTPDYKEYKNLIDKRDDIRNIDEMYWLGVAETSEYILNKLKELKERNKIDE